jgi:hypothetical protein
MKSAHRGDGGVELGRATKLVGVGMAADCEESALYPGWRKSPPVPSSLEWTRPGIRVNSEEMDESGNWTTYLD